MTLILWLLFGLLVITHGLSVNKVKDNGDELKWPKKFTLEAKRMSLTSNIIESYTIWKSSKLSRIDYNNGYVKSFVDARRTKAHRYGVKYQTHYEASLDQDSEVVCNTTVGTKYEHLSPETILPDADFFEPEGTEIINDKECTKFVYNWGDSSDDKSVVWAEFDEQDDVWIPVRYEVLKFNDWLGSKDKHEIWDFYNYDTDFSIRSVFNVDDYNCDEGSNEVTMDSDEHTTNNLLFVDLKKDEHVDHVFNSFKMSFNKRYADAKEHDMRKSLFQSKMRKVIEHNLRNSSYKLTINKFADKTPEEMKRQYMGLRKRPEGKIGTVPFPYDEDKLKDIASDLPEEYDARLLGLVSKVKNQDECGSCWTFGTTAAVEGALARVNGGRLMALSNQALVDCVWAYGAAGCDGGTDIAAYEWMIEYGLPTEAEYGPYTNQDGLCQIKNMNRTFPIRGYTDVTRLSTEALKVALVNHGPLSVSVHVTEAFSLYSSGIFYDTECDELELNHEVTLVGYGQRDDDTFWILKNSWGPEWGIGGYMYISARDNVCGVATEPTYVVF